jgi:hypothetical protein
VTLDDAELKDLAAACARRFPRPEEQRAMALAAGIGGDRTDVGDAQLAWYQLLRAAQEQGKMGGLARALAKAAPGDENLQAMARAVGVISRPPAAVTPVMLGLGAGASLALLAVGALGLSLFSGVDSEKRPPQADPATVGSGLASPTPDEPNPDEPAPNGSDGPGPTAVPTPPAAPTDNPTSGPAGAPPSPAATPPPTATPPTATPPTTAVTATTPTERAPRPGCKGPAGEVVGYYYAGTASPGSAGDTITLARDARVRADYPRAENHHNAAAREVCVLTRGTRLTLAQAPIDASKGHFWVPVTGQ